ncbi:MAG: hypothetical protein WC551_09650 [Patescibacteria group bacterium]
MDTKDVAIIGLLGTGAAATGAGIYYVLKARSRSDDLEEVLKQQAELLADMKAEVQAVGIELQNAEYPMSEAVANGIRSELANYEWKLNKAQELNEKARELGSERDFVEEIVEGITDALHEIGLFLLKPVVAIAVGIGIAKGAMYFGPKLMKSMIEWIKQSRGGPPPPWTCGGCGAQFGTQAELQAHVESAHTPTSSSAAIRQAQAQFKALSVAVANAVAAESGLYRKAGQNWEGLGWQNLLGLSFGAMAVENVGIGTAIELALLRSMTMVLLAA